MQHDRMFRFYSVGRPRGPVSRPQLPELNEQLPEDGNYLATAIPFCTLGAATLSLRDCSERMRRESGVFSLNHPYHAPDFPAVFPVSGPFPSVLCFPNTPSGA